MKTLLVIPTYNEADNLPLLASALLALRNAGDGPISDLNLLIVDDNSPDGTGQLADHLAAEHPGVAHVMHRAEKSGLGRAYVEGFSWAIERGYDAVAQMDADLSHSPDDVPKLLAAAQAGADVVIGSRYLNGISVINWPLRRILLSLGANEYVRRVTGLPIHDGTSGFRVYRTQALRAMDIATIRSNGYSFQVEMSYRAYLCGCQIVEVPIVFTERRAGHSKMSRGVILESALMPWRLRFRRRALSRSLHTPA
ncbi:MAG TPA: polyprenol monophosphomannose synthase [Capsulimonadaceae bacterium]|nr:polyprenol monophosphomannose synthase [Capsulimonadaceae bacterium]